MTKIVAFAMLIFFVVQLHAQGDFVSVKEVAPKINSSKALIIDARSDSEYKKVHIRNAISCPVAELSSEEPIEGILKDEAEVLKILGEHGVDLEKELILYCNKGSSAGRLYWILKMLGAKDVKLIDGNLDAWKAARKPITKNPKMVRKIKVEGSLDKTTFATIDYVKSNMTKSNVVLIDARKDEYFNGSDSNSKGHVPGAVSINSDLLKDEDGLLKSKADLESLLASKGVSKDKEVIVYCQTSTRAGLTYMVLTSVLEYPNVKVYDGAYNEWAAKGEKLD